MVPGPRPMRAEQRAERERVHFNRIATSEAPPAGSLLMAESNIRRYQNPPAETLYALEYAFHLLGELRGRTVLELGCGDGLNTVILAALGATVVGIDVSERSLATAAARARANGVEPRVKLVHGSVSELPQRESTVDRVLCAAILHHVNLLATAAEIRRVLKPDGVAVFLEPLAAPRPFSLLKRWLPASPEVSPDEQPLTPGQVAAVSRTIGQPGPRREFGLTYRILKRAGIDWPRLVGASLRLDAKVLRDWVPARGLASPLVWSARRPSTGGATR